MQWLVTSCSFIICLNLVTHRLSHKVPIFLIVTSVVYFVSRHRCCFCSSVVYFLSATNFVDKVMALQWEYNNIRNTLPCHTSGPSSLIFSCPKLLSFSCFKAFLWWCHWALHYPHIVELGKQQFCLQFIHYLYSFINFCDIYPLILLSSVNSRSHFSLSSKGSCLCCGPQCPLLYYFHFENQTSEQMASGQWNNKSHIKRGLYSWTTEWLSAGNSEGMENIHFIFPCTDFF